MAGAPIYIYKIVPADPPLPSPLPKALPVSDLDRGDGYLHASTSAQLLRTLRSFFSEADRVGVLRIEYARVAGVVRWETTAGKQGAPGESGCFPHLYNGLQLGDNEVEASGEWKRLDGQEWSAAGWPFGDVDVPQA